MNEIAKFEPPRLPWHNEIEARFSDIGVTKATWKALVEAVYPAATNIDAVVMALSYCKARNMDPFKRPVHIVPMWDSKRGDFVDTVWPSISELRTTAFRTGQYAGCDPAEFGPPIERTFEGRKKVKGQWEDVTVEVQFPEWCQVTVHRLIGKQRVPFAGPKVYWLETYATQGASELPTHMWERRPKGQIEKCAEAAALRKAFPEELGSEPTAEEMHGQKVIEHENKPALAPESEKLVKETITPKSGKALPPVVGDNDDNTGEADATNDASDPGDIPAELNRREKPGEIEGAEVIEETFNPDRYLDDLEARLCGIRPGDADSLAELREEHDSIAPKIFPPDRDKAEALFRKHEVRIAP